LIGAASNLHDSVFEARLSFNAGIKSGTASGFRRVMVSFFLISGRRSGCGVYRWRFRAFDHEPQHECHYIRCKEAITQRNK
jgi:hypothetical protein